MIDQIKDALKMNAHSGRIVERIAEIVDQYADKETALSMLGELNGTRYKRSAPETSAQYMRVAKIKNRPNAKIETIGSALEEHGIAEGDPIIIFKLKGGTQ